MSFYAFAPSSGGGSGTVTSITAGSGLTGGTITSSGTIALDQSQLVLNGSTSGVFTQKAAAVTTDYTVKWPSAQGAASTFLRNDGSGNLSWVAGGSGDVVGPSSAVDNAIARFDGTTGKLLQNSKATISDNGQLTLSPTATSGDTTFLTFANETDTNPGIAFDGSGNSVLNIVRSDNNMTVAQFLFNGAFAANNGLVADSSSTVIVSPGSDQSIQFLQRSSAPSNPAATKNKLYFKNDDNLYMLNSSGIETQVNGGGSGLGAFVEDDAYVSYANPTAPTIYIPMGVATNAQFGTGDTSTTTDTTPFLNIFTGSHSEDNATGNTGGLSIETGFTDTTGSTGNTGIIFISTGGAKGGTSGYLDIETGDSTSGITGLIKLKTGNSSTTTGSIQLSSGNSSAGNSGDFSFTAGSAAGVQGKAYFNTPTTRFINQKTTITNSITPYYYGAPTYAFVGDTDVINDDDAFGILYGSTDANSDKHTNDVVIQTGANQAVNAVKPTGDVFVISGSITDSGASSDTGVIRITTGDNAGTGNSGNILITPGAATGGGVQGYITLGGLFAVLPTGTSNPSTSNPNGACYYNTSTNKIMVLNGGTWRGITLT